MAEFVSTARTHTLREAETGSPTIADDYVTSVRLQKQLQGLRNSGSR